MINHVIKPGLRKMQSPEEERMLEAQVADSEQKSTVATYGKGDLNYNRGHQNRSQSSPNPSFFSHKMRIKNAYLTGLVRINKKSIHVKQQRGA